MRMSRRAAILAAATALVLSPLSALASAGSSGSGDAVTSVDRLHPWLADQLTTGVSGDLRVMVSGTSTQSALDAAAAVGLAVQQTWDAVGVVVAVGSADAVRAVAEHPDVTYVEGETPIAFTLSTAHQATRSGEAMAAFATASGQRVDGAGISIAVIDSGVDGTHPMFQRNGRTTVVRNLKDVCWPLTAATDTCFQQDPTNDTDTKSVGGHGTHVAGIAGGVEVTTTNGVKLRGSAPGASLVGLSVGYTLSIISANAAMNWVVEHHAQPCKPANQQGGPADPACPPIKVTNHSYGPASVPSGGHKFNENAADVKLQRALIGKGVVPVWAAGNSGGNGSQATTNPPGMDPTGGVLMVGNYNDANTGTREGLMATSSSRGKNGDPTTYPDLSAPGTAITSACRPYLSVCMTGLAPLNGPAATDVGTFNTISGTSMAAPYVAGVVAQLFQADPSLTPAQVELILEDTAHRFEPRGSSAGAYEPDPRNPGSDTSFDKGHGLVDVFAALERVLGTTSAPAAGADGGSGERAVTTKVRGKSGK